MNSFNLEYTPLANLKSNFGDNNNNNSHNNKNINNKNLKKKKRNKKFKLQEHVSRDFPSFGINKRFLRGGKVVKNPFGKANIKYWSQRFRLFSKYDRGALLDRESWFSVTPEKIALHIANRFIGHKVIVDAFCGVGGNTIQFAKICDKVIAIDLDSTKIAYARHNAKIYNVLEKIEFIEGDFFKLCHEGDAVFLSPPWGGPQYSKAFVFNLRMLGPPNGIEIFKCASLISSNIAYYMPKNCNIHQVNI
jgi:16S rRNA G966 N2-methylase RsmD